MQSIQTKLAPPRLRSEWILRTRLLDRLRDARQRKLVLITGPAGYGKTCLASAWRQDLLQQGWQVAWLTLNREENDLVRFTGYLSAALAQCGLSSEAQEMLERDTSDEPGDAFVVALVNSLSRLESQVCLVLDDFQELTNPAALRVIQQLIEYAPENFHLCLIARQRPGLSLARLRITGEIGEIDVADLRFNETETARYIESRIGPLSSSETRKLHELTDGWVAALLLVELAMGKRADISGFLRLRPANLRSFSEFLDAEVLDKLPREEFKLLVLAAGCRRLTGSLCAVVSGMDRAGEILVSLYDRNLFVTEISDGNGPGSWYRFHPLLRQRLLEHFMQLDDSQRIEVNRRACDWFSEHGYDDEAVRHAIYAGDTDRAANLIEACARELIYRGMFRRLIDWAGSLPEDATARRLDLQLSLAWAQVFCCRPEVTLETCRRIESLAAVDDALSRYELMQLIAAVALMRDDSDAVCAGALDADAIPTGAGTMLIGLRANLCTWSLAHQGDYDGARTAYLSARFNVSDEVAPVRRVIGDCFHGMSLMLQGEFPGAERVLRDAFAMGSTLAGDYSEPSCIAAGFLAETLYEIGQVDEVIRLVGDRSEMIERLTPLDIPLRGLLALARAHRVRGNRDEAASVLALLEEIGLVHQHHRTIAAALGEQVSGSLADNDAGSAHDAMRRLETLASSHSFEPLNATSEISLVAALRGIDLDLAERRPQEALERATALAAKCLQWRRNQWAAKLLLLQVRALLQLRDTGQAVAALRQALHLGRRGGMARTFLDSAPEVIEHMRHVLAAGSEEPALLGYLGALLAMVPAATPAPVRNAPRATTPAMPIGVTERELEIVAMLARVLTNKKIARALSISDGTVKWHLKNIYAKLGVTSRDEALARCRDLGLLA